MVLFWPLPVFRVFGIFKLFQCIFLFVIVSCLAIAIFYIVILVFVILVLILVHAFPLSSICYVFSVLLI